MSNNFGNTNTASLLSKYSGISARDADANNAMKALDNEVAAMSRAMSRINSLRNSLNPFHRLPPEIISRCFHILAEMEPPIYKKDTKARPRGNARRERVASIGWIKVTHVCDAWRCVAIGDPTLWQDLSFFAMRHNCFSTISKRSKSLPLFITYKLPPDWSGERDVIPELFNHHHSRLRSMRLYGGPRRLRDILFFAEPSPILKSLSLSYSVVNECDDSFDGKALDGIKTDGLYKDYLEELRSTYSGSGPLALTVESLTLVGFPFLGPPLRFAPKLTSLVVSLPEPYRSGLIESAMHRLYPSLGQFLDVLEGMTTLTALDLRYCSPYDVEYDPSYRIPRTASLPWLENLTLVNTVLLRPKVRHAFSALMNRTKSCVTSRITQGSVTLTHGF